MATAAVGGAALLGLARLWSTPLFRVELPPLEAQEWSLRRGLVHLHSTDPFLAAVTAALLVGVPAALAAAALLCPCSGRARDAAASLPPWCMLDVFVWAVLLYRCEEEQLVPVAWLQPGVIWLYASAALVAIAPMLAQCMHLPTPATGTAHAGAPAEIQAPSGTLFTLNTSTVP